MSDFARPNDSSRPDARPLYAQVESILNGRIAAGEWPPGFALPSEPELAQELGVSHGTVRKALDALERRHLIERRQGKGTFVARQTSERARFHFLPIRDLEGHQTEPTAVALSLDTVPAGEAASQVLQLAAGASTYRLRRLRSKEGTPFMLDETTMPAAVFPDFEVPLNGQLTDELYVMYQRRYGVTVVRSEEVLRAEGATPELAGILKIAEGTPLLVMERRTWDAAGRIVEWRSSWLDTTRHRYVNVME
ncbi:GntR family transcriptional regulator [Roseomonas elaeocarpi]|uniref:GntR family transcriptional regulator n=1 Tax=Roseomonas elaeocarpi TaxID=907779 RepID=A0ABV6JTP5_9PROT